MWISHMDTLKPFIIMNNVKPSNHYGGEHPETLTHVGTIKPTHPETLTHLDT